MSLSVAVVLVTLVERVPCLSTELTDVYLHVDREAHPWLLNELVLAFVAGKRWTGVRCLTLALAWIVRVQLQEVFLWIAEASILKALVFTRLRWMAGGRIDLLDILDKVTRRERKFLPLVQTVSRIPCQEDQLLVLHLHL